MHQQVWIIDRERTGRRQCDGSINSLETLLKQILIVEDPTPTLAVKGVRDVELCSGISLRRIGALPLIARGAELLAPEKRERVIEFLLVYLVGTCSNFRAGGNFLKRCAAPLRIARG